MDKIIVFGPHKFKLNGTGDQHGNCMYSGHNISLVNSSENNYYCNDNILTQYKSAWTAYAFY